MKRIGLAIVLSLVALPALAGASIPARVEGFKLTSKQLTVRFTDGSVCRSTMQPEGGMGMFIDCAQHARFDVKIERQTWFGPALDQIFEPYATVVITAEDGRVQTFETPGSWGQRYHDQD